MRHSDNVGPSGRVKTTAILPCLTIIELPTAKWGCTRFRVKNLDHLKERLKLLETAFSGGIVKINAEDYEYE